MDDTNKKAPNVLVFAAGLGLGYLASLFLSSSQRDQQKEKLQQVTRRSGKMVDRLVEKVFGESTQELRSQAEEMMGMFQSQLQELRDSVDSLDVKKYQKLVNDFTKEMQGNYDLSAQQVKTFKEFLKEDYETLVPSAAKKTSTRKKAAKK